MLTSFQGKFCCPLKRLFPYLLAFNNANVLIGRRLTKKTAIEFLSVLEIQPAFGLELIRIRKQSLVMMRDKSRHANRITPWYHVSNGPPVPFALVD